MGFLVVRGLRVHASIVGHAVWIPGQEVPLAVWYGQGININKLTKLFFGMECLGVESPTHGVSIGVSRGVERK